MGFVMNYAEKLGIFYLKAKPPLKRLKNAWIFTTSQLHEKKKHRRI